MRKEFTPTPEQKKMFEDFAGSLPTYKQLTVFRCGPSNCNHDYQGHEDVSDEHGRIVGGTTVCTKCGARAIDEAVWA